MVKHRTYAQVLTHGKTIVEAKEHGQVHALKGNNKIVDKPHALKNPIQQLTKCIPQKCVPFKRNAEYCSNSKENMDNRHSEEHRPNLST